MRRRRETRTRRGILSRFLAALPVDLSFSHNRPARSGYSGAREEKRSSFSLGSSSGRRNPLERVALNASSSQLVLFFLRNPIQSSDWDQCRAHRAFVYRLPFKLVFRDRSGTCSSPDLYVSRGQKLELFFSPFHRRTKGEPDTEATRCSRESDHP